ncbi:MAG: response regulator [Gammaproteobacteria bacterium]|uniref:response regulator n=1 Tax=Rhodoferax sp. TaxID=50421 RepID=UPI0017A6979E|nr:response regulator [Rhodoferax sp.]MBU3898470.1 response regulator [Gammaproteobacteria bacterium]MBA3058090.1 response regulator [Rhodoferax sp.]MBU3997797.1 response regulator [Gammaproteobacteria bacterium]MBU4079244.1 response regulator [Gammaproteobacteria bacterium]MBU4113987.1 response regulator [Gammaproteobacteria bacterium]
MVSTADILNASILIVDDQAANVQLLEQMLHGAGYQHLTSTIDPFAVCELHRANHYDLILLDLQMPGMDGFQVMQGLKEIDPNGYAPILVVTAQPGHKLRALSSGAKDFVAKPFDLVEVKTRIHNILEVRLLYKKLQNYNQVLEQTVQERTAELSESEARFRRLTELASDWYWEQDAQGHFTKVYGPVMDMLGVSMESLLGEIKQEQALRWNEAERAVLKANVAARRPFLDFVFSRIDDAGERQYFQVSGEPMFDASGRFTGYRGVGRDVSAIMHDVAQQRVA